MRAAFLLVAFAPLLAFGQQQQQPQQQYTQAPTYQQQMMYPQQQMMYPQQQMMYPQQQMMYPQMYQQPMYQQPYQFAPLYHQPIYQPMPQQQQQQPMPQQQQQQPRPQQPQPKPRQSDDMDVLLSNMKDIDNHLDYESHMLDEPAQPPSIANPDLVWDLPDVSMMTTSYGEQVRLRPVAVVPRVTSGAHKDETPDTHHATKGASESHGHTHFGYSVNEGPETWAKHFPQCGLRAQSPIDITTSALEARKLPPLIREHLWAQPESMVIENNGHTLEIDGEWEDGKWPLIRGGPLLDTYQFKQAHFHWGGNDNEGSEHTVNGRRFPMEMHVVHWNLKYGKYEEAVKHNDGLCVLAGFFEITQTNNSMIEVLLPYLRSVGGEDARGVHMRDPTPIGILPVDLKNYVTYQGSLTTPPCSEVVTWIVPITPLTLSHKQMDRMRNIVKDDGQNIHNFRPPQNLNGRKVYMNAPS